MRSRRPRLPGIALVLLAAACGEDVAPTTIAAAPPPASAVAVAPPPAAAAPALPPAPAPPKPAVVPEKPKLLSDLWYRILQDGQPSGWSHVRWTRSTYEGKPTVHDRTETFSSSTRMMGNHPDTFEANEYSDVERTEDGLLLRMETRTVQGDRVSDAVETWTGKGYERISHAAGMEEKHAVACDALCPVDAEAFLSTKLQRGEVAVGGHFEFKSTNFLGERLDVVSLDVMGRETITVPAGRFECFRVKQTMAGIPGEITFWLDGTGSFRRLVSARSEYVAATESVARKLRDGGAIFSITCGADPDMPRATSLDRAIVDVTIARRDGDEMPDFPKTPFSHEVSRKGDVVRLELTAHDEPADAVALPVTDPKLAKYLERTNILCCDAPAVKAALREAVGDERDARQVVRKILAYVTLTITKGVEPIPNPTAVEILETCQGDCSECCVLFVTLCRAAGVPARRLSGYAQVGDMWGAHAFAEVWLGRWVGCDPTTNDFGTKARYVAFGWNDDPDSFPGAVSERARGRMSIRTVEFTEGTRTWKTDGLENPSEREDVLAGLAFAAPPASWTAHVGPDTGEGHVTGPGVHAEFKVIAGWGDLSCDLLSRTVMRGTSPAKFGARDALRFDMGARGRRNTMMVPYKRRLLQVTLSVDDPKTYETTVKTLATLLAPTFE